MLVVLSVVDIVLFIAGLAVYLLIVGIQLTRIAGNLEECRDLVQQIKRNAEPISGDVGHINEQGRIIAGALPLLYNMAEGIVAGVTPRPEEPAERPPALPAMGRRRSRLHEGVGYEPTGYGLVNAHGR